MALEDIVNVQISATSAGPARENFGIPMVAAYHAIGGPLVRSFGSLREAEAAGVTASAYPCLHGILSVMFSQRRRPRVIKVGRRAAWIQTIRYTVKDATAGVIYSGEIDGEAWAYTVPPASTTATIATAIAGLINALTVPVTATPSGATIDVVGASGAFHFHTRNDRALIGFTDLSAATSIAADLTAIENVDPDFYGVVIDVSNENDIAAAAGWAETRRKILVARTHDSAVLDALITTDVASDLQSLQRFRTAPYYHDDVGAFVDAGQLAERLTVDPGSDTWAFKSVRGVRSYALNTAEENAAKAKNCNYYIAIKGLDVVLNGVTSGGEWADQIRGIDWTTARIQERVFGLFTASEKVPFTNSGVDAIKAEIEGQLLAAIAVGFLSTDEPYLIEAPDATEVDDDDKRARFLPDVRFSAPLAGAIHATEITGTLTF
jgi:hypothetical protein